MSIMKKISPSYAILKKNKEDSALKTLRNFSGIATAMHDSKNGGSGLKGLLDPGNIVLDSRGPTDEERKARRDANRMKRMSGAKSGGATKKMAKGGMTCRGMGAATKGGRTKGSC